MYVCMCMYVMFAGSSAIRGEIVAFNNSLRNQKTLKGYNIYQRHFIDFCVLNSFDHSKPNVDYLCKYLIINIEKGVGQLHQHLIKHDQLFQICIDILIM